MDDALKALIRLAGVAETYTDVTGQRREIAVESARAVLAALGLPADTDDEARETLRAERARHAGRATPPFLISEPGQSPAIETDGDWHLQCEDGAEQGHDELVGGLVAERHEAKGQGGDDGGGAAA